jgi:uncharacterized RDD family membrane protein YckC
MAIKEGFVYVGFWKRVLASLIDAAIGWIMMPITIMMMKHAFISRSIKFDILYMVVWTILWMWLVVRFGGTPGKLVIQARIVNERTKYLTWSAAFMRILFPSLLLSINSLCQTYKTVTGYPEGTAVPSFFEMGQLYNEYGHPFVLIGMFLGLLVYVDILVILTNNERRAIHDFIAGSYVITKEYYARINTAEQQICQEYGLNPL